MKGGSIMATSDRGFASMSEDKQRDIASKGGSASSGNFKNDTKRASAAGKKGAAAQSTAAKAKGGANSHRSDNT
jgi:general stress protein YciG